MSARKKESDVISRRGTVVGLFRDINAAELAVMELKNAGFTDRQIGVVMQDREEMRRFAKDTGTKAGEGAAAGAVVGGAIGLLAGIGALAIPGIGPIIAGGAVASALAGVGIGAATGGLIGALVGMGIPEEEARYYETGLREGGILVTVDAGADAGRAARILLGAGADLGPAAQFERLDQRVEELRAAKERVKAGEVRVRKEVVTDEQTIDVPVTREEVVLERHPVAGRPVSGADLKEGEEIRIPVTEEQVRVEKTPVVKEEITVGKRQVTETERVRDTVRREEARIDERGSARVRDPWKGKERRLRRDVSYSGPERRVSGI